MLSRGSTPTPHTFRAGYDYENLDPVCNEVSEVEVASAESAECAGAAEFIQFVNSVTSTWMAADGAGGGLGTALRTDWDCSPRHSVHRPPRCM